MFWIVPRFHMLMLTDFADIRTLNELQLFFLLFFVTKYIFDFKLLIFNKMTLNLVFNLNWVSIILFYRLFSTLSFKYRIFYISIAIFSHYNVYLDVSPNFHTELNTYILLFIPPLSSVANIFFYLFHIFTIQIYIGLGVCA